VLRDSLERTHEETLRVEHERSRAEELNRALHASLSWRVTKPLRSLRDLADRASRWWP
jgi:hypothetical protein